MSELEEDSFEPKDARTLHIYIKFDANLYNSETEDSCIKFLIVDDKGNPLHNENDISMMSDSDLYFTGMSLDSVLESVIENEYINRDEYLNKVKKEIEGLLNNN